MNGTSFSLYRYKEDSQQIQDLGYMKVIIFYHLSARNNNSLSKHLIKE